MLIYSYIFIASLHFLNLKIYKLNDDQINFKSTPISFFIKHITLLPIYMAVIFHEGLKFMIENLPRVFEKLWVIWFNILDLVNHYFVIVWNKALVIIQNILEIVKEYLVMILESVCNYLVDAWDKCVVVIQDLFIILKDYCIETWDYCLVMIQNTCVYMVEYLKITWAQCLLALQNLNR